MPTKLVFKAIRTVRVNTKLDKDGKPSSVISFDTDATPHNLAELIDMVSTRPINITITSPQIAFGDLTPEEKED